MSSRDNLSPLRQQVVADWLELKTETDAEDRLVARGRYSRRALKKREQELMAELAEVRTLLQRLEAKRRGR